MAIPAYYEWIIKKTISLLSDLEFTKTMTESEEDLFRFYKRIIEEWCYKSGYNFKKNQIREINFISFKEFKRCIERLDSFFHDICIGRQSDLCFEKKVSCILPDGRPIAGLIDAWHPSFQYLFELKTVDNLTSDHAIQVALYQCMMEESESVKKTFLYNIQSDECWEIVVPDRDKFIEALCINDQPLGTKERH
jgi:hypothetical protein